MNLKGVQNRGRKLVWEYCDLVWLYVVRAQTDEPKGGSKKYQRKKKHLWLKNIYMNLKGVQKRDGKLSRKYYVVRAPEQTSLSGVQKVSEKKKHLKYSYMSLKGVHVQDGGRKSLIQEHRQAEY